MGNVRLLYHSSAQNTQWLCISFSPYNVYEALPDLATCDLSDLSLTMVPCSLSFFTLASLPFLWQSDRLPLSGYFISLEYLSPRQHTTWLTLSSSEVFTQISPSWGGLPLSFHFNQNCNSPPLHTHSGSLFSHLFFSIILIILQHKIHLLYLLYAISFNTKKTP